MSSMPWIKLHTDVIDDPRLIRVNEATRWLYVALYALAGKCDAEGRLAHGDTPYTPDDLATRFHMKPSKVRAGLDSLGRLGLLEMDGAFWTVAGFSEVQGRPQSEKRAAWSQRQAKRRVSTGPDWDEQRPSADEQRPSDDRVRTSAGQKTTELPKKSTIVTRDIYVEKSREEKNKDIGAGAPAVEPPPKDKPAKSPRAPDPLFDAIVEVCQVDAYTAGASVGKVKSALLKANPPYTPDEVRAFGRDWWAWDKRTAAPTLWKLQEQIGKVRARPSQPSPAAELRRMGYVDANGKPV